MDLLHILLLAGATAWFQTALVLKSGPGNVFLALREWASPRIPPAFNPYECAFCMGFYVLLALGLVELLFPPLVTFFGVLGIAAALRGMQGEN